MAKQRKKQDTTPSGSYPTVDPLTQSLVDGLNTVFKSTNGKTAFFLSDPDIISDVTEWIPSGCTMLDLAMSNRANAGFPVGRIIEITGLESSGKSLLAVHALASTQKKGGMAVYIDTEAAVSREFLSAIGVDVDKCMIVQLAAIEDVFTAVDTVIDKVRAANQDRLVTIVVDSIMAAATRAELEGDYSKDGYATDKAIIISKAMRKITEKIAREKICLILTNQLRTRMGVSFGDQYTTSGGKAIAFHSSIRLRLKSMGQIKTTKNGSPYIVGISTRATVIKNRLGPPLKSIDYDIYFDSGIDDYGSWLSILKANKLATAAGAWYTYKLESKMDIANPDTGEVKEADEVKFLSKDFAKLVESNPQLRTHIYDAICKAVIMEYKVNRDFGIDDVEVDSDFVSEED